jgi:hypothetical protein
MAPRYGALGATFQLARLFQTCSLIAVIGMTAKFISVIVSNNGTPPNILIGTISVVCPLLSLTYSITPNIDIRISLTVSLVNRHASL